jgi:hypothetical protein
MATYEEKSITEILSEEYVDYKMSAEMVAKLSLNDRKPRLIDERHTSSRDNVLNLLADSTKTVSIMVDDEFGTKESLHHKAERRAIYVIVDAVFGLSLGLGAFSLTDVPIASAQDMFVAVGFFGFSYFVIFMSWLMIRPFFEDYIIYGSANMILFMTGFFIAIMPIPLRIVLMQTIEPTSSDILGAALFLYPICLSAVTTTGGILSLVFSKQNWRTAPRKDVNHLLSDGISILMMGLIFFISAFIPHELTIQDVLGQSLVSLLPLELAHLPFKIGFWFLGGLVLGVPASVATKIILWRLKPHTDVS